MKPVKIAQTVSDLDQYCAANREWLNGMMEEYRKAKVEFGDDLTAMRYLGTHVYLAFHPGAALDDVEPHEYMLSMVTAHLITLLAAR